jgi:hypothetical protein
MKRNMIGVLSLLATMVFALPALQAQSRVVANVDFDFNVGQKSMSAGTYQVSATSEKVDAIRNVETDAASLVIESIYIQGSNDEHARLVFNKYGNQYFLCQIWDGSSDTGIQLSKSRREQEVSLAGNSSVSGPETVVVAMK